jgi:very-short-patch-repair endonuclease
MMAKAPSSGASRHLLPRGEKGLLLEPSRKQGEQGLLQPASCARGEKEPPRAASASPSPLAGEGGSRRLTDEGAAGYTLTFAKRLRRDMTDVEKKLWFALRDRRFEQYKFRRQVPIGKYIVDFVCLERRLIVELDGSQHEGSLHDAKRDAWLRAQNFRVLRFWNVDINQALDGTLLAILEALKESKP